MVLIDCFWESEIHADWNTKSDFFRRYFAIFLGFIKGSYGEYTAIIYHLLTFSGCINKIFSRASKGVGFHQLWALEGRSTVQCRVFFSAGLLTMHQPSHLLDWLYVTKHGDSHIKSCKFLSYKGLQVAPSEQQLSRCEPQRFLIWASFISAVVLKPCAQQKVSEIAPQSGDLWLTRLRAHPRGFEYTAVLLKQSWPAESSKERSSGSFAWRIQSTTLPNYSRGPIHKYERLNVSILHRNLTQIHLFQASTCLMSLIGSICQTYSI